MAFVPLRAVALATEGRAMSESQLPLFHARRARDEGLGKVAAKNSLWLATALAMTRSAVPEGETTGELVRGHLTRAGLAAPSNPNAWGALVRTMVTRGLLVDTGRSTHASDLKSHACRVPVWVFRRG